jgi:hypothetical protein
VANHILMMRTLFIVLLSCISLAAFSQKADDAVKFDVGEHAFGKVPKGKPVTFEFKFTNPGKKPLIIEDATAECGCTKPEFPQQPIMPGKTGKIKVTYDAKAPGAFTKKVTVRIVNVAEAKILTITGEVI